MKTSTPQDAKRKQQSSPYFPRDKTPKYTGGDISYIDEDFENRPESDKK